MRKVSDLVPGGRQISASEFNRAMAELERQSRITVEYPLEVINQAGGINLRLADDEFWAQITETLATASPTSASCGCAGWRYGWEEMEAIEGGTLQVRPNGRKGTTTQDFAFEVNGACVDVGTIVRLRPAWTGEWVFDQCCPLCAAMSSSSSSSSSASGSQSSTSGNGVTVVTAVECGNSNSGIGGLFVEDGILTGYVLINGTRFPVVFNISGGESGN